MSKHFQGKLWQEYEGGPMVLAKGTHPYYNLARYGWRSSIRLAEMQRHPVCCLCQRTPSRMVDHIRPFITPDGHVSWALFSSPENHRALCNSCHNKLTSIFDGGFGNERKAGKETHVMATGESGKIFTSGSIGAAKLDAALAFNVDDLLADIPD